MLASMVADNSTHVFLLWHTHLMDDGEEDSKLLGVYSSDSNARARLETARLLPGFSDAQEGFLIEPYELDHDEWQEGYVTIPNG